MYALAGLAVVVLASQPQSAMAATLWGTVTDAGGGVVPEARVRVEQSGSSVKRELVSDSSGVFRFPALLPGTYNLSISANGFETWTANGIVLGPGDEHEVTPIVLAVASASTEVEVGLTQREVAQEQLKVEEKQRLGGVVPNYYASYIPDAAPLATRQKFGLAWKTSIDSFTLISTGIIAGVEQWRNDLRDYGQGMEGYGKRYGANYADAFTGTMISNAVLPSLFRQDPRYFYKGTGSTMSRLVYAIANTVICRGDNKHWQPNYSNVLGTFASSALSSLYYPKSRRGTDLIIDNAILANVSTGVIDVLQEFLLRKITPAAQKKMLPPAFVILREGTPVRLVVVNGVTTASAEAAIALVLAEDLKSDGVVVAKAGSKAVAEVTRVRPPGAAENNSEGEPDLQFLYLEVGDQKIKLRETRGREGERGVQHTRPGDVTAAAARAARSRGELDIPAGTTLEGYVAEDISLPAAR